MIYIVKAHDDFNIFYSESDLCNHITSLNELSKFDTYDHYIVKNCPENCVCKSIDIVEIIKTVYEKGIRVTNLRKREIYVTVCDKPCVILEGEDQRMYIVTKGDDISILHSESEVNDCTKGYTKEGYMLEDDFKKLNKIYIEEETDDNTTDIKLNILVSFNEMLKFTNNKEITYVLTTDFKYCDKDCPCEKDINIEQLIKTVCKKDNKKYTLPLNIYVSLSEFRKIALKYGHSKHLFNQDHKQNPK